VEFEVETVLASLALIRFALCTFPVEMQRMIVERGSRA
jgi:hypothetical protein